MPFSTRGGFLRRLFDKDFVPFDLVSKGTGGSNKQQSDSKAPTAARQPCKTRRPDSQTSIDPQRKAEKKEDFVIIGVASRSRK
ncbi:hypothetical protein Mapa_001916 [Marchantia paleacea]|nr:hypothetical protein Mapa_001916 [Marchantia paleacea]